MENAQTIYLQTIEGLLKDNEVERAIDALLDLDKQTQAGIQQDLILQLSNFREARKMLQNGLISPDEYMRVSARTKFGMLELMKEVPRRIEHDAKFRSLNTFQFKVPDEARLEKIIGPQNNLLKINWLEKALKASKAVCRVVCADGELGTGFLTREGYIFTNNHVLPTAEHARTARVEFNYEVDASGSTKSRTSYQLDASDYVTSTPDQFDFARVRVIDNPEKPLSQWGFVEFDPSALPTIGEPVTIIQHPKGQDKQIALNANDVVSIWNQYIFYTTDTEPGSSGSPVFNKDWKVVAIHHAGKTDAEGGLQINSKGDRRGANRGILFEKIFLFIQQGGKMPAAGNSTSGAESVHISNAAPTAPATPVTNSNPVNSGAGTPAATKTAPKFVVVFDHADLPHFQTLNRHLFILKANKKIQLYQVHEALGQDIYARAETEINSADYLLVLITSNIFNDGTWYELIMKALEAGKRVIPVRIEKFDIDGSGLEKLKSLPTMNRTVSDFPNTDSAFADIVAEIKKVVV
jgi:V8-like Glu-specific endopeptidase